MAGWIRSYERSWLKGDLIAGVTVAALIVPKIDFIDSQGSAKMREILELTKQGGTTLRLARGEASRP